MNSRSESLGWMGKWGLGQGRFARPLPIYLVTRALQSRLPLVNPDMVHSSQEVLVSVYQGSSKSGTLQRLLRAARPKADVARAP